jgi:signal transduction histidine kinase
MSSTHLTAVERPWARKASARPVILLVTPDAELAQSVVDVFSINGHSFHLPLAINLSQARRQLNDMAAAGTPFRPLAILLDDSSIEAARWPSAILELCLAAPVVALAGPDKVASLRAPLAGEVGARLPRNVEFAAVAELLSANKLDVVPKTEGSLPLVLGLLERHTRRGEAMLRGADSPDPADAAAEEFAEVFRHEVNNPLTGILGNAELLLARREQIPSSMVARLETIADLAIRLRETVRRLSNEWLCRFSASAPPPLL